MVLLRSIVTNVSGPSDSWKTHRAVECADVAEQPFHYDVGQRTSQVPAMASLPSTSAPRRPLTVAQRLPLTASSRPPLSAHAPLSSVQDFPRDNLRWQRQLNTWDKVKTRFDLEDSRYVEFEYLMFLDIEDKFVQNYVRYQQGLENPIFKNRLSEHYKFWDSLDTPEWLQDLIRFGLKIPFEKEPEPMFFTNNASAVSNENKYWLRQTITEYENYGFVRRVN